MDVTWEYWWQVSLNLKLRQSSGNGFQDFFFDVMGKAHGDDFVRVRPYGARGDKGSDGYLQSSGQVFQCYGALNGDKGKVDYLIKKMVKDFNHAKEHLAHIMKGWHMVHNLVDGLPIEAVEMLHKLAVENEKISFGFIGRESFEEKISKLKQNQIEQLLGPVATNKDAQDLQVEELSDLIKGVIAGQSVGVINPKGVEPVSVDKLDKNKLPQHWRALISGGWQNAHIVSDYMNRHNDPMIGETIAEMFNARYKYLKAQNLSPEFIMDGIYVFVTGIGSVSPKRQVAAQALLAYLFESCDIFENVSKEVGG